MIHEFRPPTIKGLQVDFLSKKFFLQLKFEVSAALFGRISEPVCYERKLRFSIWEPSGELNEYGTRAKIKRKPKKNFLNEK